MCDTPIHSRVETGCEIVARWEHHVIEGTADVVDATASISERLGNVFAPAALPYG